MTAGRKMLDCVGVELKTDAGILGVGTPGAETIGVGVRIDEADVAVRAF
jgi:hypothetical protein